MSHIRQRTTSFPVGVSPFPTMSVGQKLARAGGAIGGAVKNVLTQKINIKKAGQDLVKYGPMGAGGIKKGLVKLAVKATKKAFART